MSVFDSIESLLNAARDKDTELWELIMLSAAAEKGIDAAESFDMMEARLAAMRQADASYEPSQRSRSGLSGGDGELMGQYAERGDTLCGGFVTDVLARALRMGECNACMHRIVAAPTAGACGVLPAVLLGYEKYFGAEDETLIRALYVASGFGAVIASRASISGAEAG